MQQRINLLLYWLILAVGCSPCQAFAVFGRGKKSLSLSMRMAENRIDHDFLTKALPPVLTRNIDWDQKRAHASNIADNDEEPLTAQEWQDEIRPKVLEFFTDMVYGRVPSHNQFQFRVKVLQQDDGALEGRATHCRVQITIQTTKKSFSFPFELYIPNDDNNENRDNDEPCPIFLLIVNRSERELYPPFTEYWPVPMIVEQGFATAAFWAGDVDPDDGDQDLNFENGIHPILDQGRPRQDNSWGTIAAWAWGASRILDALVELKQREPSQQEQQVFQKLDTDLVSVIGHSRGGKTALWAAAQDERFAMAVSNNSGCTGAALSKRKAEGTSGETIQQINSVFPQWFCHNYRRYNGRERELLPLDQHYLIASIAPRRVCVASATDDAWADPTGEFLSARDAAPVWSLFLSSHGGATTRTSPPTKPPEPERPIQFGVGGHIQYHLRTGDHDLGAYDWMQYIIMARRMAEEQQAASSNSINKSNNNAGAESSTIDLSFLRRTL